jgi:hypothetical protein
MYKRKQNEGQWENLITVSEKFSSQRPSITKPFRIDLKFHVLSKLVSGHIKSIGKPSVGGSTTNFNGTFSSKHYNGYVY